VRVAAADVALQVERPERQRQAHWQAIWAQPGVRLACPACRSVLNTTWRGGDGIPYTDGYHRGGGRPTF
jgi:hypothetical protein